MSCEKCSCRAEIPGNYHLACTWKGAKPRMVATVDNVPSDKREGVIKIFLDELRKSGQAEGVLQMKWHGSGLFPFNYDPLTILACSTFKEGEHTMLDPLTTIATVMVERSGE